MSRRARASCACASRPKRGLRDERAREHGAAPPRPARDPGRDRRAAADHELRACRSMGARCRSRRFRWATRTRSTSRTRPSADYPLHTVGPLMEHHTLFPKRTNFEVVRVLDRAHAEMRVWERGVGETLSCGSGASATMVAARLLDLVDGALELRVPGGVLQARVGRRRRRDPHGPGRRSLPRRRGPTDARTDNSAASKRHRLEPVRRVSRGKRLATRGAARRSTRSRARTSRTDRRARWQRPRGAAQETAIVWRTRSRATRAFVDLFPAMFEQLLPRIRKVAAAPILCGFAWRYGPSRPSSSRC